MKTDRKHRTFIPPSADAVADYAAGLNVPAPRDIARRFIDCYAPGWRDSFNRPIRDWKKKFRHVWVKPLPQPRKNTRVRSAQKPVENWTL